MAGDPTNCLTFRVCAGIKPVYVFEGKPPELKIEQLKQRREKRDEADKELAAAKESGDQAAIEKYSKRTTKARDAEAWAHEQLLHECHDANTGEQMHAPVSSG